MEQQETSAFTFHGSWRDFAPTAFTNLLLTIVTLGIYRFWATTRERRYLWGKTHFIDDRLEWTGTGGELFKGFLLALLLFGAPFLFLQFGVQALILQGCRGMALGLGASALFFIFYLSGIARFRALRYRLGRTYWHGIRGGSDNGGFGYGVSYVWKNICGMIPIYLLVPWAMISLWNQRWNKMSFGPHDFRSDAKVKPVFKRFLLFYLAPLLLVLVVVAFMATIGGRIGSTFFYTNFPPVMAAIALFVIVIAVYAALGLIALAYYAAFLREAIGALRLEKLNFHFEATTDDWLKLFLGDIALVLGTLGLGYMFLSYRHWKFFITHMEATGEIILDELTQSETRTSRHGEGLLDALDMGAI